MKEGQPLQSQFKILFIDDHAGLRDSLTFSLTQKNPEFLFYNAGNKKEAVERLNATSDISIAIIDLNLNGENGLSLIDELRSINSEIKIIVFTMFNDAMHIEKALKKDIQGYITKDMKLSEIEKAIISVREDNIYYCKDAQKIMHELMQNTKAEKIGGFSESNINSKEKDSIIFANYKTLSKKEQEVFLLLAEKKDIFEVAKTLNKSEKTILNQRTAIFQKMNISDRLELIEKAKILGVIL